MQRHGELASARHRRRARQPTGPQADERRRAGMTDTATVTALRRYPVKSMLGEDLRTAALAEAPLRGRPRSRRDRAQRRQRRHRRAPQALARAAGLRRALESAVAAHHLARRHLDRRRRSGRRRNPLRVAGPRCSPRHRPPGRGPGGAAGPRCSIGRSSHHGRLGTRATTGVKIGIRTRVRVPTRAGFCEPARFARRDPGALRRRPRCHAGPRGVRGEHGPHRALACLSRLPGSPPARTAGHGAGADGRDHHRVRGPLSRS